eukprot:GHVN01030244.1.p1 GENE.GHVN01030244.1~~GHVN01030244.1.p1  ORF type:complete len:195 (+),score=27.11 GHVN01030244.1:202-786(+)
MTDSYGVEIAYSDNFTRAFVRIYDGEGNAIVTSDEFDLDGDSDIKRFHGVKFTVDTWRESMLIMFGHFEGDDDAVVTHDLIKIGNTSIKEIDGVEAIDASSELTLGEDSTVFRDPSIDAPVGGGWKRSDFSWVQVMGEDRECYWEQPNDGQTFSGDTESGGTTTTTAGGLPSDSVTHSVGSVALLSVASIAAMV